MEVFMLLITSIVALVLSLLYHYLLKWFPKTMFWITVLLCNGLVLGYLAYSITRAYIPGAVVSGVVFLVLLVVLFLCRERIPFDTLALSVVSNVARAYNGMTWVAFTMALVTCAWIVCFAFTVAGLLVRQMPLAILYCVPSFIYTLSVLRNTLRLACTRSFLVYFMLAASDRIAVEERGVSLRGLVYAATYHFGSVCYASMFIGMSHLMFDWGTSKSVSWDAQGTREKNGGCCSGLRGAVMRRFNTYMWSHIAAYGTPVNQAALDTWESVSSRGVDAIMGPTLIHYLLLLSNVVVGFLSAAAALVFLMTAQPQVYASDVFMAESYLVCGWLVGVTLMSIMSIPLDAGVAGLAVLLAQDPKSIQRGGEDVLYEMIWERYPEVVSGI
jgi:hypothetical protein